MRGTVRFFAMIVLAAALPASAESGHFVYSIYKGIDFGNAGEPPQKDYYVNLGRSHGVRDGTVLEVLRKTSTYDVTSKKLQSDFAFPIARLKVIHVENNAAVARLQELVPLERSPAVSPRSVMIGDLVRMAE